MEDVDCPVKPLDPEIVPLPPAATDRDPDSDGNEISTKISHIAKE